MLISSPNAVALLAVSVWIPFAGLYAASDDSAAAWARVEAAAAAARAEAEKRVAADAELTARRETELWDCMKADGEKARADAEARVAGDAAARRDSVTADRRSATETPKSGVPHPEAAADAARVEAARAEAEKRVAADAELTVARQRVDAAEMALANAEAKANEEHRRAEAAERAWIKAEEKADAERRRAAAAERARIKAEAKAESAPRRQAKAAETPRRTEPEKSAAPQGESEVVRWFGRAGDALLWYIPNRLSDLMDVFTAEVGAGEVGVKLQLTRWIAVGAGLGRPYMLGWSVHNQHGVYRQEGWYAHGVGVHFSDIARDGVCGAYFPLYEHNLSPLREIYHPLAEDPYAVGIRVGCFAGARFQIHMAELADFVAGLFFIDFKEDDHDRINWVFSGF